MSTTTPTLAATVDDRALAIRKYRNGQRPETIAQSLDADLETVTAALRRATDLPPWDDHRALGHLYLDYGYDTIPQLAALFDDARSTEAIRSRMNDFGIERETVGPDLEKLNPEDVGLSPLTDDEFVTPDDSDGQQTLDAFGGGSA